MSEDKYPGIFSRQMEAIVYITSRGWHTISSTQTEYLVTCYASFRSKVPPFVVPECCRIIQ